MKRFKGDVDGKNYDTTKVYIEESFASDNANGRGFATSEYAAGKSELFESLQKSSFPLHADVTFETVTNGKTSQTFVRKIVPKLAQVNAKA